MQFPVWLAVSLPILGIATFDAVIRAGFTDPSSAVPTPITDF
jgi:hypothetical protein